MNKGVINELKSINKFSLYCAQHTPAIIWREMSGVRDTGFDGEIELTIKDDKGRIIATGEIYKIELKVTRHNINGLPRIQLKQEQIEYFKQSNFNLIIVAYDIENDKLFAKNFERIEIQEDRKYQLIKFSSDDQLLEGENNFIDKHIDQSKPVFFKKRENKIQESLSKRLENCPCGDNDWREYEEICAGIVDYLFGSSFRNYARIVQARNENGLDIKDLVLPNRSSNPFWQEVRIDYAARNIVFEFKNYCDPIGKNQLVQISNYLKKKTYGRFAIVFTRKGLSKNGKEEQKELLRHDDKMVIVLNDEELKDLIRVKNSGESPEKILENLKTDLELKI